MSLPEKRIEGDAFIVRPLTKSDSLSVKKIWRECFTLDLNYIDNFIEHCFPYSISWGLFLNNSNHAVAMLSLLPSYSIDIASTQCFNKINGAYVYGVGTLKEHRGNGYSQILMNEVFTYSDTNSLHYILVKPAEESLFNLYRRQSFNRTLLCTQLVLDIPEIFRNGNVDERLTFVSTILTSGNNDIENHLKLRDTLATTNYLWPKAILKYSLMEIESRGGVTRYIDSNELKTIFYSAYPTEGSAQMVKVVDHNILNKHELDCTIIDIASHFPFAKKIEVELPTTTDFASYNSSISNFKTLENSLVKILTSNKEIEKQLLRMRLSLAME